MLSVLKSLFAEKKREKAFQKLLLLYTRTIACFQEFKQSKLQLVHAESQFLQRNWSILRCAPSEVLQQSNQLTTTIDAAAVTDGHLHTLKRQKDGQKGCGLCCTTTLWRRPASGEPASSSQKEDLMNYCIPILCHSALK